MNTIMQSYDNTITLRDFGIFLSHSRNFHSNGDVTIVGKGMKIGTLLSTHRHWAVRVFFSVPQQLARGIRFLNGHLRGPVTHTPVAKCFAAGLSLPVFMPPPPPPQTKFGGYIDLFLSLLFLLLSPFLSLSSPSLYTPLSLYLSIFHGDPG